MENDIKKLYDVLSRDGYYTKSFEEFNTQFEDEAYKQKVYDVVSRDKLYTKSYDDFNSKYSVKKKDVSVLPSEVSTSGLETGELVSGEAKDTIDVEIEQPKVDIPKEDFSNLEEKIYQGIYGEALKRGDTSVPTMEQWKESPELFSAKDSGEASKEALDEFTDPESYKFAAEQLSKSISKAAKNVEHAYDESFIGDLIRSASSGSNPVLRAATISKKIEKISADKTLNKEEKQEKIDNLSAFDAAWASEPFVNITDYTPEETNEFAVGVMSTLLDFAAIPEVGFVKGASSLYKGISNLASAPKFIKPLETLAIGKKASKLSRQFDKAISQGAKFLDEANKPLFNSLLRVGKATQELLVNKFSLSPEVANRIIQKQLPEFVKRMDATGVKFGTFDAAKDFQMQLDQYGGIEGVDFSQSEEAFNKGYGLGLGLGVIGAAGSQAPKLGAALKMEGKAGVAQKGVSGTLYERGLMDSRILGTIGQGVGVTGEAITFGVINATTPTLKNPEGELTLESFKDGTSEALKYIIAFRGVGLAKQIAQGKSVFNKQKTELNKTEKEKAWDIYANLDAKAKKGNVTEKEVKDYLDGVIKRAEAPISLIDKISQELSGMKSNLTRESMFNKIFEVKAQARPDGSFDVNTFSKDGLWLTTKNVKNPSEVNEIINNLKKERNTLMQTSEELFSKLEPNVTYDINLQPIQDIISPPAMEFKIPRIDESPIGSGKPVLFNQPNPEASEISSSYIANRTAELDLVEPEAKKVESLDVDNSKQIADAYDNLVDNPTAPEVKSAYDAMAKETIEQYEAILDKGYKIEIWEGEGEPYKNSAEMIADVRDNKHMYIFGTEAGFGEGAITPEKRAENAMLAETQYKDVTGNTLLVNDVFRFVHDFFGHTELGNGFGPIGEENAWMVHSRMYSPEARRAMTTETRGQNSWVNFNKSLRREDGSMPKRGDADYIPLSQRPFAEQKMGLLPDNMVFPEGVPAKAQAPVEAELGELEFYRAGKTDPKDLDPEMAKDFAKAVFLSKDKDFVQGWDKNKKYGEGDIKRIKVDIKNPFDTNNPNTWDAALKNKIFTRKQLETLRDRGEYLMEVEGVPDANYMQPTKENNWLIIEQKGEELKDAGYDSFYVYERGARNVGVFNKGVYSEVTEAPAEVAPVEVKYPAPNNKPSKLIEVEKDFGLEEGTLYNLTKTPEFKNWFGDSKAVDENGDPIVVYHGTPSLNIERFDLSSAERESSGLKEFGYYFTTNKKLAEEYSKIPLREEVAEQLREEKAKLDNTLKSVRTSKEFNEISSRLSEIESVLDVRGGRVYPVFLKLDKMKEFDAEGNYFEKGWGKLKVDAGYKIATNRDAMEFLKDGKFGVEQVDGVKATNIIDATNPSVFAGGKREGVEELSGDVYLVFKGKEDNIKFADGTATFKPSVSLPIKPTEQEAKMIEDMKSQGLPPMEIVLRLKDSYLDKLPPGVTPPAAPPATQKYEIALRDRAELVVQGSENPNNTVEYFDLAAKMLNDKSTFTDRLNSALNYGGKIGRKYLRPQGVAPRDAMVLKELRVGKLNRAATEAKFLNEKLKVRVDNHNKKNPDSKIDYLELNEYLQSYMYGPDPKLTRGEMSQQGARFSSENDFIADKDILITKIFPTVESREAYLKGKDPMRFDLKQKTDKEGSTKYYTTYKPEVLPTEIRTVITEMRIKLDEMTKEIVDSGIVEGDLRTTLSENLGVWTHRTVRAFEKGSERTYEWIRDNEPGNFTLAVRHFQKQEAPKLRKEKPDLAGLEFEQELSNRVEAEMRSIISPESRFNVFKDLEREFKQGIDKAVIEGKKDVTALKKRKHIHEDLIGYLGLVGDARNNFMESTMALGRILYNHNYQLGLKDSFEGREIFQNASDVIASGKLRVGQSPVQFETTNQDIVDPLAGMWTTPDIKEALSSDVIREKSNFVWKFITGGITTYKLLNTITNPFSHSLQISGNLGMVFANDVLLHKRAGQNMLKSLQSVWVTAGGKRFTEQYEKDYLEYVELGIVGNSVNQKILLDLISETELLVEDPTIYGVKNAKNRHSALSKLSSKPKEALEFLGKIYGGWDDSFKVLTYEVLKDRNLDIYMRSGLTESEAKAKIADYVKRETPTYSRIQKPLQEGKYRQVIAPWASFPISSINAMIGSQQNIIELYKDSKKAREEGRTEDADRLKAQATRKEGYQVAFNALMLSASTLMLQLLGDEDDSEASRSAKLFHKFYQDNSDTYPVENNNIRDKKGNVTGARVSYYDYGSSNVYGTSHQIINAWFNKYPALSKVTAGERPEDLDGFTYDIYNNLKSTVEAFGVNGNVFTDALLEIKNNEDMFGRKIYSPNTDGIGDAGLKIAKHMINRAFVPGIWKGYEKLQDANDFNKTLAGLMTGVRYHEIDVMDQVKYKSYAFSQEYLTHSKDYKKLEREYGVGDINLDEYREKSDRLNKSLQDEIAKMNAVYRSAYTLLTKNKDGSVDPDTDNKIHTFLTDNILIKGGMKSSLLDIITSNSIPESPIKVLKDPEGFIQKEKHTPSVMKGGETSVDNFVFTR